MYKLSVDWWNGIKVIIPIWIMSYLTLIGCFFLKGYDAITTLSDGFILSIITIAFVVAILLGLKYISGIKYISNKLDKKY